MFNISCRVWYCMGHEVLSVRGAIAAENGNAELERARGNDFIHQLYLLLPNIFLTRIKAQCIFSLWNVYFLREV